MAPLANYNITKSFLCLFMVPTTQFPLYKWHWQQYEGLLMGPPFNILSHAHINILTVLNVCFLYTGFFIFHLHSYIFLQCLYFIKQNLIFYICKCMIVHIHKKSYTGIYILFCTWNRKWKVNIPNNGVSGN